MRKWGIFYLDVDNIAESRIMEESIYKNFNIRVKVYIPQVSILEKVKNHKDVYKNVPLLFNYGFMKISTKYIFDRQLLRSISKRTPGMVSWLKSTNGMFDKKKRKRTDNPDDFDDFSLVAIASRQEIKIIRQEELKNRVFSKSELTSFKPGDLVVLRGYPFDGLFAKVLDISYSKSLIKVELLPDGGSIKISLPLENVLVSSYQYNERSRESNIKEKLNKVL